MILCGDGISLEKVFQAANKHGFNKVVFSPAPSDHEKKHLETWLKGAGGLPVTSSLQFAGREASTCIFITNNIVEETGARSGLLRATARLVVLSYSKDVNLEEVKKRFLVVDLTTIKEKERVKKEQPLAAEVDSAAKKGDIERVKQLQQLESGGIVIIIIVIDHHHIITKLMNHHHKPQHIS